MPCDKHFVNNLYDLVAVLVLQDGFAAGGIFEVIFKTDVPFQGLRAQMRAV